MCILIMTYAALEKNVKLINASSERQNFFFRLEGGRERGWEHTCMHVCVTVCLCVCVFVCVCVHMCMPVWGWGGGSALVSYHLINPLSYISFI